MFASGSLSRVVIAGLVAVPATFRTSVMSYDVRPIAEGSLGRPSTGTTSRATTRAA